MDTATVASMSKPTVEKLQELVQINIDTGKEFEKAEQEISNMKLKNLFRDFSSERKRQATELSGFVEMNDEVAPKDGSFLAAIRRCWMDCRKYFAENKEYAILAEVEASEDKIKQAYEAALLETAGSPVNDVLTRQHAQVKRAHDRVRDMRDERK